MAADPIADLVADLVVDPVVKGNFKSVATFDNLFRLLVRLSKNKW